MTLLLHSTELKEQFPTVAQLHLFRNANLLSTSSNSENEELLKAWKFYATELLPCVKGGKVPPLHHKKNLAHFHKIFTVSDEAFVMWVIYTYCPKWDKALLLSPEERRHLKKSKGARDNLGIPQLKRGDQKSFKEWYAICKKGRESHTAIKWVEALAEWPTSVDLEMQEENEEDVYDSEEEDFPYDSLESIATTAV
jgi:hypothetical protein